MPFHFISHGNIFTTEAEAITIAVNCLGVAGAGLALTCKKKYPNWFVDYNRRCLSHGSFGDIFPSRPMTMYKYNDPMIINFPTKTLWQKPSTYVFIMQGVVRLQELIEHEHLESVAIPKLGCGFGGLCWSTKEGSSEACGVRDIITGHFEQSPCHFYIYE